MQFAIFAWTTDIVSKTIVCDNVIKKVFFYSTKIEFLSLITSQVEWKWKCISNWNEWSIDNSGDIAAISK